MKNILLGIGTLVLIAFIVGICMLNAPTDQSKTEEAVSTYIKSNADDPSSYESVSFEKVVKLEDGSISTFHIYRIKNKFNATIKKSETFILDKNFKVIKEIE